MFKLLNSLDGMEGKIIIGSKSILTHLWGRIKRPLRSTKHIDTDVIFVSGNLSAVDSWLLGEESGRRITVYLRQLCLSLCCFLWQSEHWSGWSFGSSTRHMLCLSNVSLRTCKQLVWSQVKHWCLTSSAERFFSLPCQELFLYMIKKQQWQH